MPFSQIIYEDIPLLIAPSIIVFRTFLQVTFTHGKFWHSPNIELALLLSSPKQANRFFLQMFVLWCGPGFAEKEMAYFEAPCYLGED